MSSIIFRFFEKFCWLTPVAGHGTLTLQFGGERMDLTRLPGVLIPWYRENRRDLPWRQTKEPYHIWVSEIMLQQTRVEAVKGY